MTQSDVVQMLHNTMALSANFYIKIIGKAAFTTITAQVYGLVIAL